KGCCICRTAVININYTKHENGILPTYPFEVEVPRLMRNEILKKKGTVNFSINVCTQNTRSLLKERTIAIRNGKNQEWINDIDKEIEKM
ncbi:hypothetical protein PMAYCL1PPCAC_10091, partial [Pristionchus mayeri]